MALPRPRNVRQTRRQAKQRFARLTLVPKPPARAALLRQLGLFADADPAYFYDGQEAEEGGPDIRMAEAGEIVPLVRDHDWEAACALRLMEAGALSPEWLEN